MGDARVYRRAKEKRREEAEEKVRAHSASGRPLRLRSRLDRQTIPVDHRPMLGRLPIRQSLKRCTLSWPSWLRPSVASGTSLPTITRHICALVAMLSGALGFV